MVRTLVYAYGAKPPVVGADLIDQQISRAHAYYNKLIELHRLQYDACEAARREYAPALAAAVEAVTQAEAAVEAVRAGIKRRNARAMKKQANDVDRAALGAARATLKAARERRKEVREALSRDPGVAARLAEVYAEFQGVLPGPNATRRAGGHFKEARANCQVPWGTYLEVEKGVEAAREKTLGPPHFRRWTGDGLVAVQVQKGISWEKTVAQTNTQLRVELMPAPANPRRARLARVWLRLGSEGRAPVWAVVPMYLHRPLPEDALIMGVALIRQQVAVRRKGDGKYHPYYEWSVNFTLRTGTTRAFAGQGRSGVDLGWRLLPNGSLRVAFVADEGGRREQLVLPASLLGRFRRCQDLQSIRDGNFNDCRANLAAWRALRDTRMPVWFREATETLAQWKGKGRLASLLARWTQERFRGDEVMFALVTAWQDQDAHLWQYQRHNERRAQRARQHLYRQFAYRLAKRYAAVAVEDCDWRPLARRPDVADNTPVNETARYHQRVAAVGMLRDCLKAQGSPPVELVKTADSTRTCCRCGQVNVFEDQSPLVLPYCCGPMDQDENAALVLLARAAGSGDGANGNGDSAPHEDEGAAEQVASNGLAGGGRWARRKAARLQNTPQPAT